MYTKKSVFRSCFIVKRKTKIFMKVGLGLFRESLYVLYRRPGWISDQIYIDQSSKDKVDIDR